MLPPGEGGASFFANDLAALRWAAQHEAVNVGRMHLDPEDWPGGRMSFEFERTLAHEHEGVRDRVANFASATARAITGALYERAWAISSSRDALRTADRELVIALETWNRLYREVNEDELEQGRYARMNSTTYKIVKYLIAALMFGAETAVSIVLFQGLTSADNQILPILFAMGMILLFIVVPHYGAMTLKDALTKYHTPELEGYVSEERPVPSRVVKKVRMELMEDRGLWVIAGLTALALIALMVPASMLRAEEFTTDNPGHDTLWFWLFFLMQFAISGYFFMREWHDYGTAAVNLLQQDKTKYNAERKRSTVLEQYAAEVADFDATAQSLYGLFRDAPRWDSHVVQSYLATVHYFRHVVTLENADIAFFIANATVPHLGSASDHPAGAEQGFDLRSVRIEHPALEGTSLYSREWWIRQFEGALAEPLTAQATADGLDGRDVTAGLDGVGQRADSDAGWILSVRGPADLLTEFLQRYFGITSPYRRPSVFVHVEVVDADPEVHHVMWSTPDATDVVELHARSGE